MSNIASCAGGSGEFPDGSFEIVTENTFIMVRPIQTSSEKCARAQAKEEAASQKKTERPHKLRRHSGQDRYVRFGEHCVAVIYQDACGRLLPFLILFILLFLPSLIPHIFLSLLPPSPSLLILLCFGPSFFSKSLFFVLLCFEHFECSFLAHSEQHFVGRGCCRCREHALG